MVNLQVDELTIDVDERTPGSIVLRWLGRSASRSPGTLLQPWFEDIFMTARQKGLTVVMHFETLEHFNSSTIAALIQLIASAQSRGIPLTVHYDSRRKWQTLSFDALKRALQPADGSPAPVKFVGE
ncbi:MAG: hypothetical protein ACO1OB_28335 [Archangium sp.]